MVRYESSCGHKVEEVTPKQIGGEHGRKRKEKKRKQTEGSGRGSSLQRTSLPGRDSEGEKTKEQKQKQTRATTYNMRRARKATIYIYKWCKTAQIGRQSKDKDNGIK